MITFRLDAKVVVYILAPVLLLGACKKDAGRQPIVLYADIALQQVKAADNATVLESFIYNEDGTIKTRISYKNFNQNLISAKAELSYENGRLRSSEIQMDVSSSTTAAQYHYSKAEYEYNQAGAIIQRNNFVKENDEYVLASFSVYEYNNNGLPTKETRYNADGIQYSYFSFTYDGSGNIVASEQYDRNLSAGQLQLTFKRSYKYDTYNNPYRKVYNLVENIPFSVNSNNITEQTTRVYDATGASTSQQSFTSYSTHNSSRYPLQMQENNNQFHFKYY